MTKKELFLAGKKFHIEWKIYHYQSSELGGYLAFGDKYFCNVEKVTETGFYVFGNFLCKSFNYPILFEKCTFWTELQY